MAEDASNSMAAGRYRFRDALAALAAVQTLTEAADAAGALERIYLDLAIQGDLPETGGYVIVAHGDEPLRLDKNASGAAYRKHRTVQIEVSSIVPPAHAGGSPARQRAAMEWWSVLVGDIIDELAAYCNAGPGRPILNTVTVVEGPGRLMTAENQPGADWLFAVLQVTFQE